MQRTASSSSPTSSTPLDVSAGIACVFEGFSFSLLRPRFRRGWSVSSPAVALVSSGGSDDSEAEGVDFRGDSALLCDRVALSARPEEFEEAEEWCEFAWGCWLARAALDERRAVSISANA